MSKRKTEYKSPLLPCPFCGGKAYLNERSDNTLSNFAVTCNDCGAQGPWRKTREVAVVDWNRRTEKSTP